VAYDRELGPQLRRTQGLDVQFLGFDTTRPPFDDVRVRQAFAWAVDWRRLVELSDPDSIPATSIVPEGIELRGDGDFSPRHDPDAARAALAAAGYPGGEGFPDVTLLTSGTLYDAAIAAELRRELGVELGSEVMPFGEFTRRLDDDQPAMWQLGWAADFPHPHDFLGLLLETGSSNNVGGWSDAAFDAALDAAAATDDPAEQTAHYQEAQRIVADQVPLIPLEYPEAWALSREGLLGASDPGLGILRYAGLAWAP
jgi:oligopeptide transport system substrate-binding protein